MPVNYSVRIASGFSDFTKLVNLWSSHDKLMREKFKDSDKSTLKSILEGVNYCAFDEKNNLVASIRCINWDNLPYYTIGRMYIQKELCHLYDFTNEKNPIPIILDKILQEQESTGHYTWYYSRVISKAYARAEQKGEDLLQCTKLGKRYVRTVEYIIPPNEKTPYTFYNNMMGNIVYTRPLAIVRCNLKSEFLKYSDFFKNEGKYYNLYAAKKTNP